MYDRVNIMYCSDKEKYLDLLRKNNILYDLRIPNSLQKYLNNVILTEQITSKRGVLKLLTIIYQGEAVTREGLITKISNLDKLMINVQTTNNYTTISLFGNNLIYLLKETELIIDYLNTLYILEEPKINVSTDADNVQGISYVCHDIASYFNIIQLTALMSQHGDIYLKITDLPDEYIAFILLTCINANKEIRIHLLCSDLDMTIWKYRGIEILQRMNVNIDFSILDDIIDNKER